MFRPLILALAAGLVLGPAVPVHAQDPEARAERLRQEVELRFAARMKQELGLTSEQDARVRSTMATYAQRRRALEMEERGLRQTLARQLRPGIAADPDTVGRAIDRIAEIRVSYMQLMRDEQRELATVLSPIQRAQLFILRDRVLQRVQDLRDQRPGRPPMR